MTETINRHVFDLANQHYRELLLVAKSRRLVQLASTGQSQRYTFHARMLTWLGHWLVVWGWHLQERYGAAATNLTVR